MSTEVQRIPGNFSLPLGWPKVEFPDISSNLAYDWWADDLALGAFTPWRDRVAGLNLVSDPVYQTPQVVAGPSGHKAVAFNNMSRLNGDVVSLPQEMAISIVYNIDNTSANGARILSGADGYRLWAPNPNGTLLVSTAVNSSQPLGAQNMSGMVREMWQAAAVRYTQTDIYGKVLNAAQGHSVTTGGAAIAQHKLYVGFNSSPAVPSANNSTGFVGEIARISIWKRALSNLDIEAVLFNQKNSFGLA